MKERTIDRSIRLSLYPVASGYVGAIFPTPCTRARARHACRATSTTASALFVYVQSRYCFAARRPRRGSKQYLSHAPAAHPLRHAPPEAARRKRGTAGRRVAGRGGLLRPSVSSRLVSRDGLVSRQPSSVRIDTPATLTTDPNFLHLLLRKAMHLPPPLPRVAHPPRPSVRSSVRPSARPPVRPSARPPVRPSVRPSVRPPVRPSVRPSNPPRPDALTSSAASLLSLAASSFRSGCCLLPARAESS